MKKIFKVNIILVIGFIVTLVSCTKNFEELNTNPNQPNDVPSTNILARVIRYCGDNFFNAWQGMNEMCSFAGQITKIQYVDEARYNFREGVVNNAWTDYYTCQMDLKVIMEKSDAEGAVNMKAAAQTFSCMLWQMCTDQWKDIPYSNALLGLDGITLPTYDSQSDIYFALADKLKEAADLFASGAADALGEGDILFNGDAAKWQKFCNSLRLRLAIRMSAADGAKAKAIFEEVLGNPGQYPIMASNDDNAFQWWPGSAPYKEPYQEDSQTRDDHGMCDVLINNLLQNNDPRLPVYAHPAYTDGEGNPVYRGLDPGAIDGTFRMDTISRIGARFRDDAAGFTPYMRYAEVLFDIAEASFLGWTTGWTAKDAYEAGVLASMEENGLDQAAYDAYIAQPAIAWNNDVKQIQLQNWIAIFKQGQEAWAEVRRTDVPVVDMSKGSLTPPYGTHNRQPFRYPYPTNEANLNETNVVPFAATIVDNFWGERMWWDKRTGVN
ncbi:MAG: SusD/RagB family nutrient-binding outer membrane lipoprotein [Bacteroidetes bacterium]|nr:SusD/RagB family nutrient-binding outer membrane lipoprotein [Bacteroidota bacterium]